MEGGEGEGLLRLGLEHAVERAPDGLEGEKKPVAPDPLHQIVGALPPRSSRPCRPRAGGRGSARGGLPPAILLPAHTGARRRVSVSMRGGLRPDAGPRYAWGRRRGPSVTLSGPDRDGPSAKGIVSGDVDAGGPRSRQAARSTESSVDR